MEEYLGLTRTNERSGVFRTSICSSYRAYWIDFLSLVWKRDSSSIGADRRWFDETKLVHIYRTNERNKQINNDDDEQIDAFLPPRLSSWSKVCAFVFVFVFVVSFSSFIEEEFQTIRTPIGRGHTSFFTWLIDRIQAESKAKEKKTAQNITNMKRKRTDE